MTRSCDILLCLGALIILSPLLVFVTLIQLSCGEGKIFYKQTRIGQFGKQFQLLKFATMLENSPNLGAGDVTVENDPRILAHGQFLRKSKINELPQLLNVLKGDMSLVGPRPLTKGNYLTYSKHQRDYISTMKPGLSGIGSLFFRNEEKYLTQSNPTDSKFFYSTVISPYKAELERYYFENQSKLMYFKIIGITICTVLFPKIQPAFFFVDLPTPPLALLSPEHKLHNDS